MNVDVCLNLCNVTLEQDDSEDSETEREEDETPSGTDLQSAAHFLGLTLFLLTKTISGTLVDLKSNLARNYETDK
ncbi:hypothetical protein JZ751_026931 [Albula glossodonta]|uniref:Uncharacterized protein n=1 Tax=Albula glossodonta TaxID=121402 RepID=A0A8T2NGY7_9TELE|nr:hypothetical protein JZ751_026931 [Albula glossodonta]